MLETSGECVLCGGQLKRNGKTSAGSTRWRCKDCGASSSKSVARSDVARRHELNHFLGWLLGKHSQAEVTRTATGRTLRHRTGWCWNIVPSIPGTGEVHDEVQLDGISLRGGWCCLIAISAGHVIGWQWCDTEKTEAWVALLERFPAPRVVVIDGGSGLASALKRVWPDTRIQRCLVHVQRNVRTQITSRPRMKAGRRLRVLSLALTKIATRDQAVIWLRALNSWHEVNKDLLAERTYRGAGDAPKHVGTGQVWWYTHYRLRRAYALLARCASQQVLFTYLDPEFEAMGISSTTNHIEGGTNAGIRNVLRQHRGMPIEHRRRAVEWFLYVRSENPAPTHQLIRAEHHEPTRPAPVTDDEPIGPVELGRATTAEEGLWTRSGWGGRR